MELMNAGRASKHRWSVVCDVGHKEGKSMLGTTCCKPPLVLSLLLCAALSTVASESRAQSTAVYDFSTNAGVDRFAYGVSVPRASIPPTSNTIPSVAFAAGDYTAVAASDDSRHATGVVGATNRAAVRFTFTITEAPGAIMGLDVLFEGGGGTGGGGNSQVWLWNATTTSYELVGSTALSVPPDTTITGSYTITPSAYVDAANAVTLLVTNSGNNKEIRTDYVQVAVSICVVDADCDDGNVCTDDTCVGGACQYTNNTVACDDGLYCTLTDTCSGGSCVGSGDTCPGQMCDEVGDVCADCLVDGDCDDGLYCNGVETCVGGVCQPGAAVDCGDLVGCTDDSCNETTDSCDNVANDANCGDGLYCNGVETCDPVLDCQAGTTVDCGDLVGCTDDSCNETTDSCDNITNDANCGDGLYCNGVETCDPVLDCQAGTAVDCGDLVGCTDDSCNETTDSCDNLANDANCGDGLYCNGSEVCDAIADCSSPGDPCPGQMCDEVGDVCADCLVDGDCDDANLCTDDACVGGVCENTDNTDPCDDGIPCTDAVCQSGSCVLSDYTGQITVDLEVEAIDTEVTRDVTFVVTTCGGSVDVRVLPVIIGASGTALVGLNNIDADADWIAVNEGHTLRRLAPLTFAACSASVDLTGVNRLHSGDFHTGVVGQDNLVDITDFSILGGNFMLPIDPDLSTGADATGDGVQGTADFTAIQVNFLTAGDPADACGGASVAYIGGLGRGFTTYGPIPVDRVHVATLTAPNAWRADLNEDGVVDVSDIREFALENGLMLLPEFEQKLRDLEDVKHYRRNRR